MNKAIGVFDSGVGGLTVLDAVRRALPNENYVFLGDTARVPYGNRTPGTIVRYATSCVKQLIARDVKAIVIACNTASAYALEDLKNMLKIPVFGVIDPAVHKAVQLSRSGCVGIIGTRATIRSNAYVHAIRSVSPNMQVVATPCPLFVPLVEEGWTNSDVARIVAKKYLSDLLSEAEKTNQHMDTLILGCTHYPILKSVIAETLSSLRQKVVLCDCAQATADSLALELRARNLLDKSNLPGNTAYLVTDDPDQFSSIGRSFMADPPSNAEHIDIKLL